MKYIKICCSFLILLVAAWFSFFIHTFVFVYTEGWYHAIRLAYVYLISEYGMPGGATFYLYSAFIILIFILAQLTSGKLRKILYILSFFLALNIYWIRYMQFYFYN